MDCSDKARFEKELIYEEVKESVGEESNSVLEKADALASIAHIGHKSFLTRLLENSPSRKF